ncbi:PH domain-containing protein [Mycoplasma todarodis]|uniref:PH domain-containing protein n=1 Tax=Mycoplasma todarodis TaxID=1937191 RepID=UPI003B389202
MHRAIVVTFGVLIVFAMVLVVTIMVRKKQTHNTDPQYEEFQTYQEDMMNNGYDIFYDSEPSDLQKGEDLIYQLRTKMSDVDFERENPETKPEPTTIWITNKRLTVERRGKKKKNYSFAFSGINDFEFELEKNKYTFLFDYEDQTYKFETKDIYALALIELKVKIGKNQPEDLVK